MSPQNIPIDPHIMMKAGSGNWMVNSATYEIYPLANSMKLLKFYGSTTLSDSTGGVYLRLPDDIIALTHEIISATATLKNLQGNSYTGSLKEFSGSTIEFTFGLASGVFMPAGSYRTMVGIVVAPK